MTPRSEGVVVAACDRLRQVIVTSNTQPETVMTLQWVIVLVSFPDSTPKQRGPVCTSVDLIHFLGQILQSAAAMHES